MSRVMKLIDKIAHELFEHEDKFFRKNITRLVKANDLIRAEQGLGGPQHGFIFDGEAYRDLTQDVFNRTLPGLDMSLDKDMETVVAMARQHSTDRLKINQAHFKILNGCEIHSNGLYDQDIRDGLSDSVGAILGNHITALPRTREEAWPLEGKELERYREDIRPLIDTYCATRLIL